MFARHSILSVLSLSVLAALSMAQDAQTVLACGASIVDTTYTPDKTFVLGDTSYFNTTLTYNAEVCFGGNVPISRIQLLDVDGGAGYNCPKLQFTSSGVLDIVCTKTYGDIAAAAADGYPYWALLVAIGTRVTYGFQNEFAVTAVGPAPPAPEPSNTRKRQLARAQQPQFSCLPGQSYCWTGRGKNFACVNTSSDVASCGSCPYSEESTDCSSIEGVDNVTCRDSRYLVSSCEKGYQVSTDRASCVRVSQKRVDSRFWTR